MADRYWVGGTASWDATAGTKWATTSGGAGGAAVPTSADNVFFDANSGSGTVTVATTVNALDLDFTGFTGTFAGTNTFGGVYGSLTLSSGMTLTYSTEIIMRGTTAATITTNGKSLTCKISVDKTGSVTLQDAFTSSKGMELKRGTLDTNNKAVSLSTLGVTNTATKTLTLGASTVTCTGGGEFWSINASSTTINAASATIKSTPAGISTLTFAGGGFTYGTLSIEGSTANTIAIGGANTFGTLASTRPSAYTITFPSSTTTTVETWSINGSNGKNVSLRSSTAGTQFTLAKSGGGTVEATYLDIKDSAATPGSTWVAKNSIDSGNNTGWTITAPPRTGGLFFGSNF